MLYLPYELQFCNRRARYACNRARVAARGPAGRGHVGHSPTQDYNGLRDARAAEAIKNLTDALTDDVITFANGTSRDKSEVEEQTELRKHLATLRAALAKVSASEKLELVKKLDSITAR